LEAVADIFINAAVSTLGIGIVAVKTTNGDITMNAAGSITTAGGNVDFERMKSEIMDNLNSDYLKSDYFNCLTNTIEEREVLANKQVIIIEGVYSMHKALFSYYTLTVFLEIDSTLQRNRILARNGEAILSRFTNEWIPLENYYFKTEDLKNKVDLIIDLNLKKYYSLK